MAICLCVEGSIGLCVMTRKLFFCATCQHGASRCKHVNRTLDLIQEQPPPVTLQHWKMSGSNVSSHSMHISCKSTNSIPYQYSQSQQDILKQMRHIRLNIKNEVAHLYPHSSRYNCPICEAESWSDLQLIRESIVVTETAIIPAKGIVVYTCILENIRSFY